MKKNLITIMTITAMLASSAAVFAQTEPTAAPEVVNAEDELHVMPVSEDVEISAPISMPSYISNVVTVTEITDGKIATKTDEPKETESELENVINYTTSENTLVYTAKGEKKSLSDIKKDSAITVFTGSYTPAPLIMPPQYQADVIIINDAEQIGSVDVDTYLADGDRLVNAANSLVLNIGDTTEITDVEGAKAEKDTLANCDLIVFYTMTTRSIPAQTTPEKVIVLGENETALANIEAAKAEAEATPAPEVTPEATPEATPEVEASLIETLLADAEWTTNNTYVKEDGTVMVPLRQIAEKLEMTVEWDGEIRAVMINGGMYSLKIGENSYIKGKMMPIELKAAPEITNDLTYVPAEYFTEVID